MRLGIALAATALTALTPSPASAAGSVTFDGDVVIDCFGCGASNGSGTLCVNGTVDNGRPVVCLPGTANDPNVSTTFVVNGPAITCQLTGDAAGTTAGDVNVSFEWIRVGATAVITTSGDIDGSGTATFTVTSPPGNPCGMPVTAHVTGTVTGN
jgi:hypothetical protein